MKVNIIADVEFFFSLMLMQEQPVLATLQQRITWGPPIWSRCCDSCSCVQRVYSVYTQHVCHRVMEMASEKEETE